MKRATRRAGGWQGWAAGLMVAGGAWLGVAEAASQAQTSATGAERTVPANARTSLVDLEQALGQARANRDKAMSDLTAVWRQLMASREELEQVRQQMDENARAVSRVRESERKLKRKTEEEEAARRQVARLQAELAQARKQAADWEGRAQAQAAVAEQAKGAQADVARLTAELAERKRAATRQAEALEKRQAIETAKMADLEKEKAALATAAERSAAELRQELDSLRAELAVKAKASTEAAKRAEALQTEVQLATRRISELEKTLSAERKRLSKGEQEKTGLAQAAETSAAQAAKDQAAMRGELAAKEKALAEAGKQGDLVFRLVSRGDSNAVVRIQDIMAVTMEDPDQDGLSNADETVRGTDLWGPDSDRDGLDDKAEVETYLTDPLVADSDDDGATDGDEVAADTDPQDPESQFAIKSIQTTTNGIPIEWWARDTRMYRVIRSSYPDFNSYNVIAGSLTGTVPSRVYIETPQASTSSATFLGVQVETQP